MLKIFLLGKFQVERNDQPIPDADWVTQKAQTLLKILLTHRQRPPAPEQLWEWLWPAATPTAAATNLRSTVSRLRRALEPDLDRYRPSNYIHNDTGRYHFCTGPHVWLDVDAFEQAIRDGRALHEQGRFEGAARAYQTARKLYRGEYLEEDRFADWPMRERERLRELYMNLLTDLADIYMRQQVYQRAAAVCREIIDADPLREGSWRQLMLCYYEAGERAQALGAYRECAATLEKELGVAPLPETKALYEQLLHRPQRVSATAVPNNLPRPFTLFIGREKELAAITERLGNPGCRLLTVVGPGGAGKSRLVVEAARTLLSQYPDGIFFVALASVPSADLVATAIAQTLNYPLFGHEEPQLQLQRYLHQKQLLLILDNLEHLLAAREQILALLAGAPRVKILVTARQTLHLQAEWLLDIGGLPYPPAETTAPVDGYPAVQLFLERAARVRPDFSPDESHFRCIARICRTLEGSPLAIELAAARMQHASCHEITSHINHNLDYLTTSMADIPPRHRSIRAIFATSWKLLSPEQKRTCRQLAVFHGRFSEEAAVRVVGCTAATLTGLVEQSLLQSDETGQYEMHLMLRQFAGEKLQEQSDEKEAAQRQHAVYYATYLAMQEQDLMGTGQRAALAALGQAIENIRAAWNWAAAAGEWAVLHQALEALYRFHLLQGWFQEGEQILANTLERIDGDFAGSESEKGERQRLRARLMTRCSRFLHRLGRYDEARALLHQSLAILQSSDDAKERALCLYYRASLAYMSADYLTARAIGAEALELYEHLDEPAYKARCLIVMGLNAMDMGEAAAAGEFYEAGLAAAQAAGDERTEGLILGYLAMQVAEVGDYQKAWQLCQASLVHFRRLEDRWATALILDYAGHIAIRLGEIRQARDYYLESLAIRQDTGNRWGIAASHSNLGRTFYHQGAYADAERSVRQSLRLYREIDDPPGVAGNLRLLGCIATATGEYAAAQAYLAESWEQFEALNQAHRKATVRVNQAQLALAGNDTVTAASYLTEALRLINGRDPGARELELVATAAAVLAAQERPFAAEIAAFVAGHPAADFQTRQKTDRLLAQLNAESGSAEPESETVADQLDAFQTVFSRLRQELTDFHPS